MTRDTEPTPAPAPETTAAALPGHPWPVDTAELERRRAAQERRDHATRSLPEAQRDATGVGALLMLRLQHDWHVACGLGAEARIKAYTGDELLARGIPILRHARIDALELTAEQLEAELFKDLGRGVQLRLNRMAKREQEAALARSRAIALGAEVDTLIKRMTDPTLPPHRRREAHDDLRQLSPARAAEFVELMEADLSRIAEHDRVERRRVQAAQEAEWQRGIPEAQAEADRIRELGEKTLELEGA